jgi:uncharacterized surface protein with fasciclin (FAS1) repeats
MKTSKKLINIRNFTLAGILFLVIGTVSCSKEETLIPEDDSTIIGKDIATILDNSADYPELFTEGEGELKSFGKRPSVKKKVPTFKNLILALAKTNLLSTVARNQLTVLAPSDEAFEMLFKELGVRGIRDIPASTLKPILLYHVIGGKVFARNLSEGYVPTLNGAAVKVSLKSGVMFNDANVTYADIRALNGVIHVIDKVLLPPTQNIVEVAQGNEAFSTLVGAVIAAELAGVLSTGGPFTVFAPTNDAFEKLRIELKLSSLDQIPVDVLTNVLKYHVVSGRVYSSDLPAGPLSVKSINGESFTIDASMLKITDFNKRKANLIPTLLDIQATNGVIHVIDTVILPDLGL